MGAFRDGAKEKLGKLGEKFKKRTKEERETFKADSCLDVINKYLQNVEPARYEQFKDVAAFISNLNLDDESVQTIYSWLNDEEKRKLIKSNSNAIFLKDSLNELRKVV